MTTDEIYQFVSEQQPALLYITGKTCTGKTTLSNRLRAAYGYELIQLDEVVVESVVQPLGLHGQRGEVFTSVYKTGDNAAWTNRFVTEFQRRTNALLAENGKILIDGAVANVETMHAMLDAMPDIVFAYFHPLPSSPGYVRNLTKRFKDTTAENNNGLPTAFWEYIDKDSFTQFCKDRIITPELEQGIAAYAQRSTEDSILRLKALQKDFPSIKVVEV